MLLRILGSLGAIVLVDLALSGDNALIIGAAASGLERRQRMLAIVAGGAAAIVLRIAFTIGASLLLLFPLLEAIGGGVLLVIAVRLLIGREEHAPNRARGAEGETKAPRQTVSLGSAMLTIMVADVTMSLDNILAVGGVAHGDVPLLAVGLLISIALLLIGSAIIASLIGRLPWLLDLAALVLGWTAGSMIYHDGVVHPYLSELPYASYLIPAIGVAFVLLIDIVIRLRRKRATSAISQPAEQEPGSSIEPR